MTGRIAERVRRIKPSSSTSAAARADQLRREGHSIVSLVVGEPDFDTPGISERRRVAPWTRAPRYTALAGTLELRQAICSTASASRW